MGSELQGAGGYRVGDADRNRTTDLLKEPMPPATSPWRRPTSGSAPPWPPVPAESWTGWSPTCRPSGGPVRNAGATGRPLGRQRPAFPAEVVWLMPLVMVVTGVIVLAVLTRGFWFFPWPLLWIFFFAFGRRGRAGWRPPRW
jgi:hypothetical protein